MQSDWSLSIGKITSFQFPTGNGIRVDTHLISGHPSLVSADFDSLIAKLIITASSWPDAVRKAQRALADTWISGVKTNIDILRGIIAHPDFLAGKCDTQWLKTKQQELVDLGLEIAASCRNVLGADDATWSQSASLSTANTLFRKGDAWSLTLSPPSQPEEKAPHHLQLTRVLRNDFPSSLSAEILFTSPSTTSTPYILTITSTSATAAASISHHRRANPSDQSHIGIPFPGKLVEVLVDEGDVVKEGDVVAVVQQMKMELEVRTSRSGRVNWVTEAEEGEEVAEGMLVVVVESEGAKL